MTQSPAFSHIFGSLPVFTSISHSLHIFLSTRPLHEIKFKPLK